MRVLTFPAPSLSARLAFLVLVFAAPASVVAQTSAKVPANWTDDMPSVAKVEQQVQGTDPTDTLERQVAVFEYLQVYVNRIKETRDYKGPYLPAESQLLTDYAKAQYDLQQSYNKTHTQQEIGAFGMKEGQYSENNALDWIKQLQGNQAAVAYTNTEADLAASEQRNDARIQQGLSGQSGDNSPLGGITAGSSPNTAANLTAGQKRCLELYGDYNTCIGMMNGAVGAMASLYTAIVTSGVPSANAPPPPPPLNGVVLVGLYHSRTDMAEIQMWDNGNAILSKCGTLADNPAAYTLRKSGGTTQILVPNEPDPIVLTLQPDGSLAGPGTIQVKGNIIIGTSSSYQCINGNCTTTSNSVLQAKMDSCKISLLSPQPLPTQTGPAYDANGIKINYTPPPANGYYIAGDYTSSGGMQLSFADNAVILDCGQAHVSAPYTVTSTATQFVIQVQNSGSPFQLVVAPDTTLRGSGSATVNGRLVASVNGQNVTYTAHSETCSIASLSPKGSQNTMVASSAPMPSPPPASTSNVVFKATPGSTPNLKLDALPTAGNYDTTSVPQAQLRVLLSSSFTGTNPLAGQAVFVSRKPMDQILRELGVSVPVGSTPAQAMAALQTLCHSTQGCSSVIKSLPSYYVTTTKLDSSGKAVLSATATTGAYYFFAIVPSGNGSQMWDVAANLAAGDNPVTFTQANSQQVQ